MKIAVTGSNGFLGSHMADFLEKKGHEVIRVTRRTPFTKVDQIYHLAANHGGVGYISNHEYEVAMDNLEIDSEVIRWAEKTGARLFYPSSSCIYPDNNGEPQGVYGYEKLLITKLSEHAPFDMRVGILGTIYGPGQSEGEKAKFPVDVCKKVLQLEDWNDPLQNPTLEIWGNGKQVRSFLYVDDFCEMAYELMSADYESPVNIASEEKVTVQEITDALCEHAGITPFYDYNLSKPSGAQERREDVSEWQRRYHYRPKTTAAQGFAKLYDYLKSNSTEN